ncbi:unnamed protein product [Lota lota]
MVKPGSNLCHKKLETKALVDDGFDNIPLITPLEVNQLQHPHAPPNQVIVKTKTQYELQQKRERRLYVPSIRRFNINFYSNVSEKTKITGLILITLAFLTSLLLLLMYKALWYDQLTCPEGFVLKGKHCAPTGLEMYYTEQQQREQPGPEERGTIGAGFYAALSHLNKVKRTRPEMVSPWLPVIGTLKEGGGPARESMEEPLEGELEGKE